MTMEGHPESKSFIIEVKKGEKMNIIYVLFLLRYNEGHQNRIYVLSLDEHNDSIRRIICFNERFRKRPTTQSFATQNQDAIETKIFMVQNNKKNSNHYIPLNKNSYFKCY